MLNLEFSKQSSQGFEYICSIKNQNIMNFKEENIEKDIAEINKELKLKNLEDNPEQLIPLLIKWVDTQYSHLRFQSTLKWNELRIWDGGDYQIIIYYHSIQFIKNNGNGTFMIFDYLGVTEEYLKMFKHWKENENSFSQNFKEDLIKLLTIISFASDMHVHISKNTKEEPLDFIKYLKS